jgi:HAD superfamily hydrolase (TIGR01509 family)
VSCDLNSRKSKKEFWEKAIKEISLLGLQIQEVLFIDDYLKNIEMAEAFGIKGFHAKDEQEICLLKKQLAKYAFRRD